MATNVQRVKYLSVADGAKVGIKNYPNFHRSGSVRGMRKIYGKFCLLVQCGEWIYNVHSTPSIYELAH